jgi:hypothetical protein
MKFCEVRDKLEGQTLARRHSAFLAGNQGNLRKKICAREFTQETLRSYNNPARLRWFHSLNVTCLAALSTARLTRRANHRHIVIVATISPRPKSAAGFFITNDGRPSRRFQKKLL